jgi:glucose/arabinose dehydrogenase
VIAQLLAAATLALAPAAVAKADYAFRPFVNGLDSPVYVTSAPGDSSKLYVVEQPGRILVVENGRVTDTFLDIRSRVRSGGEQGLLSVAFSPGYAQNHRFYVDYTDVNGDTRVVEFRSNGTTGLPDTARQLLFVKQPYSNHNGGQLQFDKQGFLYVGMGDGGSGGDPENRAQNLGQRLGKLLRINPLRAGAKWQIVGYGLRNPWRFSFDRANGNLWIGDVGQGAWEEIDFRPAARLGVLANYGWPRFEGNASYDSSRPFTTRGQLVKPVTVYPHSAGACSVTGGYVYRGSVVPAAAGRYFYGDYCNGVVWSFRVGSNGRASAPRRESFTIPNLSSFGEAADGSLYATSLNGSLYRLGG